MDGGARVLRNIILKVNRAISKARRHFAIEHQRDMFRWMSVASMHLVLPPSFAY